MSQLRTFTTRAHRLFFTLLLPLALVACGGATEHASTTAGHPSGALATGPLDACALVTHAEAEAALGVAVATPRHDGLESAGDAESPAASTCRYDATSDASLTASVFVRRSVGDENTPTAIAATRSSVGELARSEPQDVPGLGDAAFWGAGQLNVFVGGRYYLIVSVDGTADDTSALAAAHQLAQAALAKL